MKIGHDLVSFSENPLPPTRRHGKKIMTAAEFSYWENIGQKSFFYWLCWSVKESLYKLNMKLNLRDQLIFTELNTALDTKNYKLLPLSYKSKLIDQDVFIKIESTSQYIQTFAANRPLCGNIKVLMDHCQRQEQKKAVRELVNSHFLDLQLTFEDWQNRARYPILVREGKPVPNIDVSLSHDGNIVSACVVKG